MYLLKKSRLHRLIGRSSFLLFAKKLKSTLFYVSGINELDSISQFEDPIGISLTAYPKGLRIKSSRKDEMTGVQYGDIRGYTLKEDVFENEYHITLHLFRDEEFVCSFEKKGLPKVLSFIRAIGVREIKTKRSEEEIRASIERLREHFLPPEPGSIFLREVAQEVGTFGMVTPLELTNEHIIWKGRKLKMEDATGFSYGIDRSEPYEQGYTYEHFNIIIHEKHGEPMHVKISGLQNGPVEPFYHKVVWKLYALLSVREIHSWLGKFIEGETVVYDKFSLTRGGMHIHTDDLRNFIPWEDLRIFEETKYTFVSLYNRDIRLFLDARYDRRANMLQSFNKWLLKDKNRLKALVG